MISFKVIPFRDYDDAELSFEWNEGGLDDTEKRFVKLLANCGLVFDEFRETVDLPTPCSNESLFVQRLTIVKYSVKTARLFLESAFGKLSKGDRCGFESIIHAVAVILTQGEKE